MKIAIITNIFPQYSEKFTFDRVLELIKSGFDVTVYAIKKGDLSYFSEDIKKYRILDRVVVYPSFNLIKCFSSPFKVLRCLFKDYRKLHLLIPFLGKKYDVVHFEFGTKGKEMIFLKGYLPKTKFITSFMGYDLHYLENKDYEELFKYCDRLHFISEYLLEQARKIGYKAENYEIINPAINPYFYKPPDNQNKNQKSKLTIISVGRLHWRKGYPYALSAVKILKERGYSFLYRIIGSGDMEEAIKDQIRDDNLESCVELVGAVASEQVKEYLSVADIFLHTAVCEGFCNAILEAQAMQVPVVCTNVGGLKENIVDNETGLFVPARDPKDTAEKLIYLFNNPVVRKNYGDNGRQRVIRNFSLDKQTLLFKEMYLNLR